MASLVTASAGRLEQAAREALDKYESIISSLHFRQSNGDVNQGLDDGLELMAVWGARQSGQDLFFQHFAGN
jgi:hypothetical protein